MVSTLSKLSTWVIGAAMTATLFASATPAYSAAIVGELNFAGSLTATATTFDFFPDGGVTGDFQIVPPNTGFFSTLAGSGKIKDFNNFSFPLNTTVAIAEFLTFTAAPTVSFTATRLPAGSTNPALAATFTQNGANVAAAFSVDGFFVDSTTPGATFDYTGSFTTQFNNTTVAAVLATLEAGGSRNASYSATFSPAVPEPDILPSLLGLGMVLSGAVVARRRISAAK
jgi:hypothetical protein